MSVKSVKFRTVPFWHELKQSDKQAAPQRVVIAGQTETYDSIKEAEVMRKLCCLRCATVMA